MPTPRARSILGLIACVGLAGCYYASGPEDLGGSPASPGVATSDELPCEVATVLSTYCWGCHTSPPRGGAPMGLTTLEELAMPSSAMPGQPFAERAIARMMDSSRPMPPAGLPRPSAAEIDGFAAWVASEMPPGACGDVVTPPDPGPPPEPVCSSGTFWPEEDWDEGHPDMNPGLPCRACHIAEEKEENAFFFMGTVFPTLYEQDRCFSSVPAGTRIEILDSTGAVALTIPVRARGNFMSPSRQAGLPLPFTARVVTSDGRTNQMSTPQMTGDCNGCHTEQGQNGAPGRILLPL